MSGHFVEGSVIFQQTELKFLCHPVSPLAAPCLPQCVMEARGGESRFAMNTRTQLQFNLAVSPNPDNRPTHFHLHPSPVVIERLTPSSSASLPTAERLALAVRLARRDLKRGKLTAQHSGTIQGVGPEHQILPLDQPLLQTGPPYQPHPQTYPPHQPHPHTCPPYQPHPQTYPPHQPHPQTCPPHQPHPQTCPQHLACPQTGPPHQILPQTGRAHQLHPQTGLPHHSLSNDVLLHRTLPPETDLRHQPHLHVQEGGDLSIAKQVTEQCTDGQEQDLASREIAQLRKELEQQVQLLNRTQGATEVGCRSGVKIFGRGGGRVWWQEAEGEEEREQRRKTEQASRNARLLYNLQQQVSSLQQEIQRLPGSARDSIRHTKKSQMVHRLAAVHRAAVRTLQSYLTPRSSPIPPELAKLVQRLSLLRAQLKVGVEDADFQQTLKELEEDVPSCTISNQQSQKLSSHVTYRGGQQVLQTPRSDVLRAVGSENSALGTRPLHRSRGRRRKSVKPKGVLLMRRGAGRKSGRQLQAQPPRFSWHTHSTLLKQQLPAVWLQPHLPPPVPPHSTPSQTVKPKTKSRRKECALWQSQPKNGAPKPVKTSECEGEQSRREEGHESRGHEWKEEEGLERGHEWREEEGLERGHEWREEDGLGRGHEWGEEEGKEGDWREERQKGIGQKRGGDGQECRQEEGEGDEHLLAEAKASIPTDGTTALSPSLDPRGVGSESVVSVRMEEEHGGEPAREVTTKGISLEEHTRQEGKSQLEDSTLLVPQSPDLSAMLRRVTEMEAEEEQIRLRWSTVKYSLHMDHPPTTEHSPPSSGTASLTLPLPSSLLSSIHQYKGQYYHHLRSAGSGIQGVFHPWTLTGSIADELLDDLLLQVITEVEQICDSCVDGLITEEFVKP